jgi:hypothetical protein
MMNRTPASSWLPANAHQAVNRDEFDDITKPARAQTPLPSKSQTATGV